jgi:taurine dioxygenase
MGIELGTKLKVERLGYALGASVRGVDCTRPLPDAVVSEIRRAWLDNVVLCFPDQDLDAAGMIAFCSRFGELDDMRRTPQNRHPEFDTIAMLSNKPVDVKGTKTGGHPYGRQWHSDRQFTDRPASASFLNAKILPDVGGDTMFTNMYVAYETLSPAMQRLIDPLEAVHDMSTSKNFASRSPEVQAVQRELNPPVIHPVVRVHPETGRKALFVGEYVRNFVGMTPEETAPILQFLNEHAIRYEFIYRHVWKKNDLVMWDNRCTMHRAIPDFDLSQMRQMIRCALIAPKSGRYEAA